MAEDCKRKALEAILKKLEKLLPHLGNENDGEALSALRKITALLRSKNLDWHDLIALMSEQKDSIWDLLGRLVEKESDALVRLGREGAEFFHARSGEAYADVMIDGRRNTWPLASAEFSDWFLYQFFREKQKAPPASAVKNAVRTLGAHARFEGSARDVCLRTAVVGGKVYINIADPEWHIIEVDRSGWRVLAEDAPVRFRRTAAMQALPLPEPGGSIKQLRSFVNLSDDDFILFVAVLTDALGTVGPHPLPFFQGNDGSAKTTLTRLTRLLVDPAEVLTTKLVDEEDLFVKVHHAQMLAFDNVSVISRGVSDVLCQIVSGSGFERRKRYTDSGLFSVGGRRSIIMNGRVNPITGSDLADRTILFPVPKIKADDRRVEGEFWRAFEAERAKIFGALLDIVACGLRRQSHVRLSRPPRMADFAQWGCACETAFAKSGTFLAALTARAAEAVEDVIESDPVATAVAAFMHERQSWRGSATRLLNELNTRDPAETQPSASRKWPKDPVELGKALSGQAGTVLHKVGIAIERGERSPDRRRDRILILRRIEVEPTTQAADGADSADGRSEQKSAQIIALPAAEKRGSK